MKPRPGFDALMHFVCEQWCLGSEMDGYGETSDGRRFFPEAGSVTADQFVEWVFLASGPDAREPAPMWQRAKAEIREAFIRHMGGENVDVGALRWNGGASAQPEYLPLPDPEAFARNLTVEELAGYREEFGEDSREWIIAQREMARRKRRPFWVNWLRPAREP